MLTGTGNAILSNQIRQNGIRNVPPLASTAESAGDAQVTIPSMIPSGRYFVIACADGTSQVVESNESNNCLASVRDVLIGP